MRSEALATSSLDGLVLVYRAPGFETIASLRSDAHFVKGLAWDPLGQWLVAATDDRSMDFWDTTTWTLQRKLTKPFEGSPSTFFRRPSWTSDGQSLALVNATDRGAPVCSVLNRGRWSIEGSLVGHTDAVNVVMYSPASFKSPASADESRLLALGSKDNSISIWITGRTNQALLRIPNLFERQIYDIKWSADGRSLFACSHDGSVAAIQFDAAELAAYGHRRSLNSRPSAANRDDAETPVGVLPDINRLVDQKLVDKPPDLAHHSSLPNITEPLKGDPPQDSKAKGPAEKKKRRITPALLSSLEEQPLDQAATPQSPVHTQSCVLFF